MWSGSGADHPRRVSFQGDEGIGPEGAKALAEALRVNAVLTQIGLRCNLMGDAEKQLVRDAVSGPNGFKLLM
jgi:hypothetical protein